MYDYVLVIGPGRSGSEFLYRALNAHPDFCFPEIKEGMYYRSLTAFKRARKRLPDKHKLLCDISNLAYLDPALFEGIEDIKGQHFNILLITLIRDHKDRAISMMRFRRSRGELSALFGRARLETSAVRDRLTPQILEKIFQINVDVLTIHFSALIRDTTTVLDVLASFCGASKFDRVPEGPVNESVRPRFIWFSTFGRFCGVALRSLGFRRLLQRLKDSELVKNLFFAPLPNDQDDLCLTEASIRTLNASYLECCSIVESSSEKIGNGIYFKRTGFRS